MTKDQKALILFQLDNLIDLNADISPEKSASLIAKVRDYVEGLQTGGKRSKEAASE